MPALLALVIRRGLKEPEKWQRARDAADAARGRAPAHAGGLDAATAAQGAPGSGNGRADAVVVGTAAATDTLADHNSPRVAAAPAPRMGSY